MKMRVKLIQLSALHLQRPYKVLYNAVIKTEIKNYYIYSFTSYVHVLCHIIIFLVYFLYFNSCCIFPAPFQVQCLLWSVPYPCLHFHWRLNHLQLNSSRPSISKTCIIIIWEKTSFFEVFCVLFFIFELSEYLIQL